MGYVFIKCISQSEASLAQSPLQRPVYEVTTLYKIGVTLKVTIEGREEKNRGHTLEVNLVL